jgi:hypothetical protein
MKLGAYDGANRNYYFQGVGAGRPDPTEVIPGRRDSGEPGSHDGPGAKTGRGSLVRALEFQRLLSRWQTSEFARKLPYERLAP